MWCLAWRQESVFQEQETDFNFLLSLMEDEELKSESGDAVDIASNQESEDESLSEESLSALFSDDESGESKEDKESNFLANLNKLTGKNFKSLKDAAKSIKQVDETFREKGREKKVVEEVEKQTPKTETVIPGWAKALYIQNNPEYQFVQKKVEKIAKQMGRDPFEVYEDQDFSFFKSEAKSLYEEANESEGNKGKVKNPSSPSQGKTARKSNIVLSEADRALLSQHGLSEKDVKPLTE